MADSSRSLFFLFRSFFLLAVNIVVVVVIVFNVAMVDGGDVVVVAAMWSIWSTVAVMCSVLVLVVMQEKVVAPRALVQPGEGMGGREEGRKYPLLPLLL
jgi:hypothetical protein